MLFIIYAITILIGVGCYLLLQHSITVQCSKILMALCAIGMWAAIFIVAGLTYAQHYVALEKLLS